MWEKSRNILKVVGPVQSKICFSGPTQTVMDMNLVLEHK